VQEFASAGNPSWNPTGININLGIKHFPLQIKRCSLPLLETKVLTTEHMLGCLFMLKLTTMGGRE